MLHGFPGHLATVLALESFSVLHLAKTVNTVKLASDGGTRVPSPFSFGRQKGMRVDLYHASPPLQILRIELFTGQYAREGRTRLPVHGTAR